MQIKNVILLWSKGFHFTPTFIRLRSRVLWRTLSQSLGQDSCRMPLSFEFINFLFDIILSLVDCHDLLLYRLQRINNVCKILPSFVRNCQIFVTLFHAVTIYLKRKVFFFVNDAFFYNYLYIFFYHSKPDRCILAKVYGEQLWLLTLSDLSFTLSKFLQPCDCDKNCWLS